MHPDELLTNLLNRLATVDRLHRELDALTTDDAPADLIVSCLASIQYHAAALHGEAAALSADLDPATQ